MTHNLKKSLSILLTACLVFTLIIPVFAQGSDITNHWARTTFEKWTAEGLLNGYADGSYKPDNTVTKVEFVTFIDRIFKYIDTSEKKPKDVVSGAWYEEYISRALAAGIIQEDKNGNIQPQKAITRGEAAVILAKAFNLKAKNPDISKKYTDYPIIPAGSIDAIAALTEKGYIKGNADGTFGYGRLVTRAEAITIINRAIGTVIKSSGIYKTSVTSNLTVNSDDVVLKDITIGGDLYLTQGIGQGGVTLDNVKVRGKTFIFGGGDCIKIKDSVLSGTLVLSKKDGNLRVVAQGTTDILNTQLYSGAILEEESLTGTGFTKASIIQNNPEANVIKLSGDYTNIDVKDKGVKLQLIKGSATTLLVSGKALGSDIFVSDAFVVTTVTANSSVNVSGSGKITNAIVNSPEVGFEQLPENLRLPDGITVIIGGTVKNTGYGSITVTGSPADISGTISFSEPPANIAAASIQLKQNGTNACSVIHPGSTGAYTIKGVTPGIYSIEFSLEGYKTATTDSFELSGENITGINITLAKTEPTLDGSIYIYPDKGTPGDACSPYIVYQSGEKLVNGTVVFHLPNEFKATINDSIMIGTASALVPYITMTNLTDSQISNDGTTITLSNITTQEDASRQYIKLELDNRTVPAAGTYKFSAKADADGILSGKAFSSGTGKYETDVFTSASSVVTDFTALAQNSSIHFTFSPSRDAASVVLQMSTDGGVTYTDTPGVNLTPESSSANVTGLVNGSKYMFRLVVTGGGHNGMTEPITISPTRIYTNNCYVFVNPAITVNTDGTFDKYSTIDLYLRDEYGNPIRNSYESMIFDFANYSNNMNKAIYINGASESISDSDGLEYGSRYYLYNILTDSEGKITIKVAIKAPAGSVYDGGIALVDPNNHGIHILQFSNKTQ